MIEAVLRNEGRLVDLWESSPYRLEGNHAYTEEIIDSLFPSDALLCCAHVLYRPKVQTRQQWRGKLSNMQFIVPSPMIAVTGVKLDGEESARTLENTGPRRFLVIEFDFTKTDKKGNPTKFAPLIDEAESAGETVADISAGLLLHLSKYAPFALAVHSGGKSVHGWFYCGQAPEEKQAQFMGYAALLGADTATWTKCQWVRMPDGIRRDTRRRRGPRQRAYFFNPGAIL